MNLKIKLLTRLTIPNSITSRAIHARPAVDQHWWLDWTRHLSVGGLVGPASWNWPESRLHRFRRAADWIIVMPVDNVAEAIGIMGTPSPAPPSWASCNGGSVRVNADAVVWTSEAFRVSHSIRLKVCKLPMLLQWICIQEGKGAGLGLDQGILASVFLCILCVTVCRSQKGVGSGRQEGSGVGKERLELVMVTCSAPALTKVREKRLDWG